LRGWNTSTSWGIVHYVIVVQSRQVGKLNHNGSIKYILFSGITKLSSEQNQGWAHAFAAGLNQVSCRGASNFVSMRSCCQEAIFDQFEARLKRLQKRAVGYFAKLLG
jgi:hypothetical protein